MNNLLSAGFARLVRTKLFYVGILAMSVVEVMFLIIGYTRSRQYYLEYTFENSFFIYSLMLGIVQSAFCSLFLSVEYSDGAIRNRLIAGHSRVKIYLSNLIVNIAAGAFFCLSAVVVGLCVGLPLFGAFFMPTEQVFLHTLCALGVMAVYASVYTAMGMLCENKVIATILCVVLAFFLLFLGQHLFQALLEPEFFSEFVIAGGKESIADGEPNPYYLRGLKRQVYSFFNDLLPGGQSFQIQRTGIEHPWRLLGYSGILVCLSTGVGLLCFNRKNLK